ncbi:MAG: hypothetical protein WC438_02130 [Candidatus Pacearchaeota archaeon]
MKNKKGEEILESTVIFILLNLMFFAAIFFGVVYRVESGASVYEQIYAKQIALTIDQAKTGMNITLNLDGLMNLADKNKISRANVVKIDNEKKLVQVIAANGEGYSYNFFTDNEILWSLKVKAMKLEMKVK